MGFEEQQISSFIMDNTNWLHMGAQAISPCICVCSKNSTTQFTIYLLPILLDKVPVPNDYSNKEFV